MDEFETMWDGHPGRVIAAKHLIYLTKPGKTPILQNPYRGGPLHRELEKMETDKMILEGVIELANIEWASSIVIAPKKDRSARFCVDFRKANAVTVRDSYPIPQIYKRMDCFGDEKVISTLDANAVYCNIEMDDDAKKRMAFLTHHGLFSYKRLQFELKDSPATFKRAKEVMNLTVECQYAFVYLEHVVVFPQTPWQQIEQVAIILPLMKSAGITLKLKKCFFFTTLPTTLCIGYAPKHWKSRRRRRTLYKVSDRQRI